MRLDTALSLRDGIQDLRHPMADIVTHDIFHEQAGQQDTDHRIKQIEIVHAVSTEITRQYICMKWINCFNMIAAAAVQIPTIKLIIRINASP